MNLKTKKIVCLLIGITSILTIVSTISYAYFTAVDEVKEQVATISAGLVSARFADNDFGVSGELNFGESITKKFTIENTGTEDANIKMYFKNLINTYSEETLTYTLLQAENLDGPYTEVVSKTSVPKSRKESVKRLAEALTIPVGKTYYYNLVITLNYLSDINQDADLDAKFSSSFDIRDINASEPLLPKIVGSSSYNEKLWSQKANIKTIVFENELNPKENAIYTYDLSEDQNGSIMSYLVQDDEDTTKYIAYIQSDGGIRANENSLGLFAGFKTLEKIENIQYLDTSEVTTMQAMFSNCSNLVSLDLGSFDTSNVTSMVSMFNGCSSLISVDLSSFDTSNVTNMSNMFSTCRSLIELDLGNFDTSNVTNMSSMFNLGVSKSQLSKLNISSFDTSNVTNMDSMFYGSHKLTELDLSNFNTSKVTDMSDMFNGGNSGNNLVTLDLSNFDTSQATIMYQMFNNCYNLTSLDLSNINTDKLYNIDYMFNGCKNLQNLDLRNWNTSKLFPSGFLSNVPNTINIKVSTSEMKSWVINRSYGSLKTSNVEVL